MRCPASGERSRKGARLLAVLLGALLALAPVACLRLEPDIIRARAAPAFRMNSAERAEGWRSGRPTGAALLPEGKDPDAKPRPNWLPPPRKANRPSEWRIPRPPPDRKPKKKGKGKGKGKKGRKKKKK